MLVWDTGNPFSNLMANFYIGQGRILVDKMLAGNADWEDCAKRNEETVRLVKEGKMVEASLSYGDMLADYMAKYWPDCTNPFWKAALKHYQEAKERVANGEDVTKLWPTSSGGPPPAFPQRNYVSKP
jgi:hypothetical protein